MIKIEDLVKAYESNEDVEIICTNGQVFSGDIVSVDDEEESGLDEPGISLFTPQGGYIGLGISEIESISLNSDQSRILAEA